MEELYIMPKTEVTIDKDALRVTAVRTFETTREKLFQAYTNPGMITKWWGPRVLSTVVDQLDMREGGSWRFIQKDHQGKEFAFHGVYKEITQPSKLVSTFEFEG